MRSLERKERMLSLLDNIEVGSKGELLLSALEAIPRGGAIYTPNAKMLWEATGCDALYTALLKGVNIPDGVGVRFALRRLGVVTDVLPGVELGERLLSASHADFGIIGGKAGVAEVAADRLSSRFGAKCCLALDGYSYSEDELISAIAATMPKVVFICLGSPKQEIFIDGIRERFPDMLFLALGGSADVYSGKIKRAPALFQRLGLEWLYRMLREPKRLSGLPSLIGFFLLSLKLSRNDGKKLKNSKQIT